MTATGTAAGLATVTAVGRDGQLIIVEGAGTASGTGSATGAGSLILEPAQIAQTGAYNDNISQTGAFNDTIAQTGRYA